MQNLIRLLLLIALSTICSKADRVEMCDVRSFKGVVGKEVALAVRMLFTPHGAYLLTDQCSRRLPTVVPMNPGDPGTPKVDFELDGNAINKLTPYIGVLGTAKACGTVVGEFVHKDGFKGKRVGEIWVGNGFGAQGSYEFGFVLRSVSEIAPCH